MSRLSRRNLLHSALAGGLSLGPAGLVGAQRTDGAQRYRRLDSAELCRLPTAKRRNCPDRAKPMAQLERHPHLPTRHVACAWDRGRTG